MGLCRNFEFPGSPVDVVDDDGTDVFFTGNGFDLIRFDFYLSRKRTKMFFENEAKVDRWFFQKYSVIFYVSVPLEIHFLSSAIVNHVGTIAEKHDVPFLLDY